MKRIKALYMVLMVVAVALLAPSCIYNNIPYPRIQANFVSIEARGQDAAAQIDTDTRTVTLTFPEEADIYNVRIDAYTLSPGVTIVDNPFGGPINLSEPLPVYLHLYQDWLWTIIGNQPIERYFEIEDQMGETVIDVPAHRIVAYASERADLSALVVKRAKLAQRGSTMTPDIANGGTIDATRPVTITVDAYGHVQTWTLYVEVINKKANTNSVDAWTKVAWVYATVQEGLENGIQYRLAGTEEWTDVPAADMTTTNGSLTACIKHLSPNTAYQTRAYSGGDYGDILDFTTGSTAQLPNANFEYWWQDGKIWCPWPQDGTQFWDTGNRGAATLGDGTTSPSTDTPTGTGYSAKCETSWKVIKLAAGSIFSGKYVRTDGTNGILDFGQPWTDRPTKLRGYFKYTCAPINKVDKTYQDKYGDLMGQPDTGIIYCALIDTDKPFEIRTNPKDLSLLDANGSYIVAYGSAEWSETVADWTPFEFSLEYRSTSRVPKYIIVAASASKLGDYFVGGVGSTLFVDDFVLEYDY